MTADWIQTGFAFDGQADPWLAAAKQGRISPPLSGMRWERVTADVEISEDGMWLRSGRGWARRLGGRKSWWLQSDKKQSESIDLDGALAALTDEVTLARHLETINAKAIGKGRKDSPRLRREARGEVKTSPPREGD